MSELPKLPEPDAYIFQHDETGLVQFVDPQQVEWGFEANNPRLHRFGEAYSAARVTAYAQQATEHLRQQLAAANERVKELEAQRVPDGWKLVPVEPTDSMVQAAHHLDLSYMPGMEGADRAAIYRAMLSAAPQPAAQPEQHPDDEACRCEPSDWSPPADYDGDGSVDAMARRAAQPEQTAEPVEFCSYPKCMTTGGCKGVCSKPPTQQPKQRQPMTDEDCTRIYKQANGEDVGKAQPLTTQRIFRAMRAAAGIMKGD